MGRGRKAVGAAALSVSVIWFLVVVNLSGDWNDRKDHVTTIPSIRGERENRGSIHHQQNGININCVSKRRVPNGPDPIHNRRVGNSHLPPT